MRSSGLMSEIGTEHGLNALPLMWLVHAWHTPRPQPYFGPVTPRTSRRTHSRRTSSATFTRTRLPLRMKVWFGTVGSSSADPVEAVGRRWRDRRTRRIDLEAQRPVVVDRERGRHLAGGAGVGARDGGHRRPDTELPGATRVAG